MRTRLGLYRFFWRYAAPWRIHQGMLAAVSLSLAVVSLVLPFGLKYSVDAAVAGAAGSVFYPLALTVGAAMVFEVALRWYQGVLISSMSMGILEQIRSDLHGQMLRLPWAYYAERNRSGLISNLVLNDVTSLQSLTVQAVQEGANSVLMLAAAAAALAGLSLPLFFAVLLAVPFFWWQAGHYGREMKQMTVRRQEAADKVLGHLQQSLTTMRDIKVNVAEDWRQRGFQAVLLHWSQNSKAMILKENIAQISSSGTVSAVIFACLILGIWLVQSEMLTIGTLVAFLTLIQRVFAPIRSISQLAVRLKGAAANLERIEGFLKLPGEPPVPSDARAPSKAAADINLRQVTFTYHPAKPVLRDITLAVPAGCCVALVGASGSGKSTLAKLLVALYPTTSGAIEIGGDDVSRMPAALLRSQVAYVPQEPVLFEGTVMDNLLLGRPVSSGMEPAEAARQVGLHEVIMRLPRGYHTILTADGYGLSFGERQRLCLARALLRHPSVLIVDEGTAGLDAESEQIIHRTLAGLSCTRVLITHKPSTLALAGGVFVLNGGCLAEVGSPEALAASRGPFVGLFPDFSNTATARQER